MGKPMIQWPIEAAQESGLFDRIIVSTDDKEIAELAESLDCRVHWRDTDDGTKGTQEIARDVLMTKLWSTVLQACVIYPCSPFLTAKVLKDAGLWFVYGGGNVRYVVSSYPDRIEDCGCFYFGNANAFRAGDSLVSDLTRVFPLKHHIDINTEDDWKSAEEMFTALKEGK